MVVVEVVVAVADCLEYNKRISKKIPEASWMDDWMKRRVDSYRRRKGVVVAVVVVAAERNSARHWHSKPLQLQLHWHHDRGAFGNSRIDWRWYWRLNSIRSP